MPTGERSHKDLNFPSRSNGLIPVSFCSVTSVLMTPLLLVKRLHKSVIKNHQRDELYHRRELRLCCEKSPLRYNPLFFTILQLFSKLSWKTNHLRLSDDTSSLNRTRPHSAIREARLRLETLKSYQLHARCTSAKYGPSLWLSRIGGTANQIKVLCDMDCDITHLSIDETAPSVME